MDGDSAGETVRGVTRKRANVLAAGPVTLLGTDEALPYALWIARVGDGDDTVGVTVHDGGAIVGVVANDDPAAVEWAEGVYADYRAATEPVDPGSVADGVE